MLTATYERLEELGCIKVHDGRRELGKLGRAVSKLSLEPRMGTLVYYSAKYGCTKEIIDILSVMQTNMPLLYSPAHGGDQLHKAYKRATGGPSSEPASAVPTMKPKPQAESIVPAEALELLKRLEKLFGPTRYMYSSKLLILGDIMFSLFVFRQFQLVCCLRHVQFPQVGPVFCRECRDAKYAWCNLFNVKCKTLDVALRNSREITATFVRYCYATRVESKLVTAFKPEVQQAETQMALLASIYTALKGRDLARMSDAEEVRLFASQLDIVKKIRPKRLLKQLIEFYCGQCYEPVTRALIKVYGKQICIGMDIKKQCKRVVVEVPQFLHRTAKSKSELAGVLKRTHEDRNYLWDLVLDFAYINVQNRVSSRVHEGSVLHTLHYWAVKDSAYEKKIKKLAKDGHLGSVFPPRYVLFTEQMGIQGKTVVNLHAVDEQLVKLCCKVETRTQIGYMIDLLRHCHEYMYLDIGPAIMRELCAQHWAESIEGFIKPCIMIPYYQTSKIGVICAKNNAGEMMGLVGSKLSDAIEGIKATAGYREAYWKTGVYVELGLGGQMEHVWADGETRRAVLTREDEDEDRKSVVSFLLRNGIKFSGLTLMQYEFQGWMLSFKSEMQLELCRRRVDRCTEEDGYRLRLVNSALEELLGPHADFVVKMELGYDSPLDVIKDQLNKYYGPVHKVYAVPYEGREAKQAVFVAFKTNEDARKLLEEGGKGHDVFRAQSVAHVLAHADIRVPVEIANSPEIVEALHGEIQKLNERYGSMYIVMGGSRNFIKVYSDYGEMIKEVVFLVQPEVFTLCRYAFIQLEKCSAASPVFEGLGFAEWCRRRRTITFLSPGALTVRLYGVPDDRLGCKNALMRYVSEVLLAASQDCVNLAGYPYRYAKTLYDFMLYWWPNVDVYLDSGYKQISIHGASSDVEKMVRFIEYSLEEYERPLGITRRRLTTIPYSGCKICLSTHTSRDRCVVLGLCGHQFCRWCISMQIASALRNHPHADLPLVCAVCRERMLPLNWESAGGLRYYYKILYAAMQHWMLRKTPGTIEWCQNPNCKAVYSKELLYADQTTRYCSTCKKTLCLLCGLDVLLIHDTTG